MYGHFLKRMIDFTLASIVVFVSSPIFLLLCLIIRLDSKGPVFFKQRRIGKDKIEFDMLKFRTMRTDAPKDMPTHLLKNPEAHITKVGKILRKTSLDELPQLFNIMMGKMSIVGPRPALWNQYDLISERDNYGANNIRPGLTGWAQVNGRDELTIPIKSKLDGQYVNKMSFMFDLKCVLLTIVSVPKAEGVVEGNVLNSEHETNNSNAKGD